MNEYIVRKFEDLDDFGNSCKFAEIQFDKPVLRNDARHCKHFYITYSTEEELSEILTNFKLVEELEPEED